MQFRATTVLGLNWTNESLSVAEIHFDDGHATLGRRLTSPWPQVDWVQNPVATGRWLRGLLSKNDLHAREALVSIPREETVLKLAEFPTSDPREIASMATLLMEGRDSSIVEHEFDYLPQTTNDLLESTHLLFCSVDRKMIEAMRTIGRSAGLAIVAMGVGELTLGSLVHRQDPAEGLSVNILASEKKIEFVFGRQGTAIGSYSYPLLDPSPEILRAMPAMAARMTLSLPDELVDDGIMEVRLLGSNAELLLPSFESYFDVPVFHLEKTNHNSVQVLSLAAAIVLNRPRIDFLATRHRLAATTRIPKSSPSLVAAALILICLIVGSLYANRQLNQEIASLEERHARQSGEIERGQSEIAAAEFLQTWKKGSRNWSRDWMKLDRFFPESDLGYLERIDWRLSPISDIPIVHASGFARRLSDVMRTNETLVSCEEYELQPQLIRPGIDNDYQAAFTIKASLKDSD